jgi:hypothetical protein
MSWQTQLRGDPLPWILDTNAPSVRYLALRDLLDLPEATQSGAPDDPQLAAARREAHRGGPIAAILAQMDPAGFWVEPGPSYLPKYRSSVTPHLRPAQVGAGVTVDNGVKVLAAVAAANENYRTELLPYLLQHLRTCRPKDVLRIRQPEQTICCSPALA